MIEFEGSGKFMNNESDLAKITLQKQTFLRHNITKMDK